MSMVAWMNNRGLEGKAQLQTAIVNAKGGSVANHVLIAAVAGKIIRAVGLNLASSGAMIGQLRSGTSGTLLSQIDCSTNRQTCDGCGAINGAGYVQTAAGEALTLEQTAGAGKLNGHINYITIDPAED